MAYTTVEHVRAEINASLGFASNTIPSLSSVLRWIREAESQIDFIAQRSFNPTTFVEYIDYDGSERLTLKAAPLLSVTTVEYNTAPLGQTPSWITLTANTNYLVYDESGEILLIKNNLSLRNGYKNIRITGQSGFATIPGTIQMLATKMVAIKVIDSLMMEATASGTTEPERIKIGGISIVEPSTVSVGAYKQLRDDVDSLKKELVGGFGVYRYGSW